MKRPVQAVITIGVFIMFLHTLFPPRKLSTTNANEITTRVGRETILRKNFYLRFTDKNGEETSSRYSGKTSSIERVNLDWDLFFAEAVMIMCLTTIGALGSSMLAQPQRKQSEQAADGDAE
jgi:hypothetical protein